MLSSGLILMVASGSMGQVPFPDQLDILRGADTRPQIEMVLDTSGSMFAGGVTTSCAYYYNTIKNGALDPTYPLVRFEMLAAVLSGCQTATDGIFDKWASRVSFAIREFGGTWDVPSQAWYSRISVPTGAGFSSNPSLTALETAVLNLVPQGITPISEVYAQAARNISSYFNNSNSATCRQNFIVLMTDGDGTGWTTTTNIQTLALGAGNAPVTFGDGQPSGPDAAARHLAFQDGLFGVPVDSLPNVTGVQPIRTYTISLGNGITAAGQSLLSNMASGGGGQYYPATSYTQLDAAFSQIILSIVARSNVGFSTGTIQGDGLFSGNYVYTSSFKPYQAANWFGTTKKHCITPANATDTTCVFMDDGSNTGTLITNPTPLDIWSNTSVMAADVGGTGAMIWSNLFGGVTSATAPVPSNPLGRRNILTWRPGTSAYVPVDGTGTWSRLDSYATTDCNHYALMNKLHGYTQQVQDCANADYAPVALEQWPIGDVVNGDTIIMKYSRTCEQATDNCWVVNVANDGMIHFYNSVNGVESSAVIPGYLWESTQVVTHQLRDLSNQPNLQELRKFYFDGGVRLFHDDVNANGYIDNGENAKLIAGLGRGGKSYIMWDMTTFNGTPTASNNPPLELMVDEDSSFRNLRETWAAPWLGRYRQNNSIYDVAIFASGHDRNLDAPTANIGGTFAAGLPVPSGDQGRNKTNEDCSTFMGRAGPAGAAGAVLCNQPLPASCTPCNTTAACLGLVMCYDWPGWIGNPLAGVFGASGGPGVGHNILLGPFSWSDANSYAVGFQVHFEEFDLQAGDYMAFYDSNMNEVGRMVGTASSFNERSPWIDDTSFYVRLVTDGIDSGTTTGFEIKHMHLLRRTTVPSGTWRPTIYTVDLNAWNAPAGSTSGEFVDRPGTGDTRQESGVLLRIVSDCEGLEQAGEVCLDATGSAGQPPQPDLAYMTCAISMEPAILDEGGLAEGIYWGDECGQIFRATRDTSGVWSAKRLLATNQLAGNGRTVTGNSKDFRKIFADLELVRSNCTGATAVGVYFGTGNMQRAGELDNLRDPAVADFSNTQAVTPNMEDVYGVVWDYPGLPQDADLNDLENVTNAIQVVDPRANLATNGWFIETYGAVLRAPLVFDGVAYFREFILQSPATECISARSGESTIAVNNCTARPATDGDGSQIVGDSTFDRYVEFTRVDIGGDMVLYTPARGLPTVITGGAAPLKTAPRRATKFLMWRTIVDPLF